MQIRLPFSSSATRALPPGILPSVMVNGRLIPNRSYRGKSKQFDLTLGNRRSAQSGDVSSASSSRPFIQPSRFQSQVCPKMAGRVARTNRCRSTRNQHQPHRQRIQGTVTRRRLTIVGKRPTGFMQMQRLAA